MKNPEEENEIVEYPSLEEFQNDSSNENKFTIMKNTKKPSESSKKRHYSQPGISYKNRDPTSRPVRSMASMDDIVYDPNERKFTPRKTITDTNDTGYETTGPQVMAITADTLSHFNGNINQNKSADDESNFTTQDIGFPNANSINEYRNPVFLTPNNDVRSTNDKFNNRQHKISTAISLASVDMIDLQSTSSEEKNKTFKSTLTTIISCMYGIFLITLGLIIFIADIFIDTKLSELYCLYLVIVGLIYLIFLYVDIRIYTMKAHKYHEEKKQYELSEELKRAGLDHQTIAMSGYMTQNGITSKPISPPKPLEHPYCFTQGRHAGSFYLKMGAAAFFLGHLVHSILFLSLQIIYLLSDKDDDCGSIAILILDILYPLYSCAQLFFIFKYSNVIIMKCKELGRFALMHCIASSLCFWVWTIIREIIESLTVYAKKKVDKNETDVDSSEEFDDLRSFQSDPALRFFNVSSLADDVCLSVHEFDNIIESVFPYLYPFTIEFSILIAGVFFILWQNIDGCTKDADVHTRNDLPERDDWDSYKSSQDAENCKLPTPFDDNGAVSNMSINIDCHSSNRGMFFGLIVLVASIVSIIICFIALSNKNTAAFGTMLKDISELCLHLMMLIAAIFAYYQIKRLDINHHPVSLLDDLLLFVCIPAFYMEACLTLVPTAIYLSFIKFFNVLLMVLQVTVQTPLIIDALRRCSNSRKLRKLKPGRELITFLIVCNVATWIFETFSVKNAEVDDARYKFYGKILWTILGHISTPLCMFYRFHSSVCLADIWKCAYQPGNSH